MTRFLSLATAVLAATGLWTLAPLKAQASESGLLSPIYPAEATGIELTPHSSPRQQPRIQGPASRGRSNSEPALTFSEETRRADQGAILSNYGLIGTLQNKQLSVLLISGKRKVYPLAKPVLAQYTLSASSGLPPSQHHLKRGKLVGFETNRKGEITRLVPTPVRRIYDGTVVIVEGKKIGLVNYQGERLITTLSKKKIESLNITPGKRLLVTQYEGTWATKVCEPGADESTNAAITEAPVVPPIGGPIEALPAAEIEEQLPPAPIR